MYSIIIIRGIHIDRGSTPLGLKNQSIYCESILLLLISILSVNQIIYSESDYLL